MESNGLPYFLLMCQMDEKVELIEAEYGMKGFAVVVKLWQRIYGMEGYYCEWTKEVELLFARKVCNFLPGDNFVSEIVRSCLKRGLFSQEMFDKYHILTSHGVQVKFLQAAKRRTCVKMKKEYLLVSDAEIPKNVDIISENVYRNEKNVCKNQQKREEKRREENIREEGKAEDKPPSPFDMESFEIKSSIYLRDCILKVFPKATVPKKEEDLQKWAMYIEQMKRLDHLSEDEIRKMILFATKDTFWQTNIRSTKSLRKHKDALYMQMNQPQKKETQVTKTNRFVNYQQREWDFEELERLAQEKLAQER